MNWRFHCACGWSTPHVNEFRCPRCHAGGLTFEQKPEVGGSEEGMPIGWAVLILALVIIFASLGLAGEIGNHLDVIQALLEEPK